MTVRHDKVTVTDDRRAQDRIARDLRALSKTSVTVGVHDSGAQRTDGDESNVTIAATHEFGAGRVPERSFLRSTFDKRLHALQTLTDGAVANVIDGTAPDTAMERVGIVARGMVQGTIQAGINPPLSAQRVAERDEKAAHGGGLASLAGQHTPLIDTGQLLSSITYEVKQR